MAAHLLVQLPKDIADKAMEDNRVVRAWGEARHDQGSEAPTETYLAKINIEQHLKHTAQR